MNRDGRVFILVWGGAVLFCMIVWLICYGGLSLVTR